MIGTTKKVADAIKEALNRTGCDLRLWTLTEQDWEAVARAAMEAYERDTKRPG